MKVINPTDKDITVQLSGVEYTVKANDSLSGLSRKDAEYWRDSLHQFLVLEDEGNEKLEKKEVVKDEEKEDEETDEIEIDLEELTRPKLDEIAESIGLTPADYKNKDEIIEAIMAKEE